MACNCNNGKTFVVSLTTVPGGTAANANYVLALDYYTCGNKKLCTQEVFPVTADIKFTPLGVPQSLGNDTYCQEVLVNGTCTYMPFKKGCQCQCCVCPVSENIYTTICVPCSSAAVPTLTAGTAVASPTNVVHCENITNCIAITTSLNVTTA